nr:MAG TPA: hypothetical protein [Caudoviricetes sp.]
MQEYTTLLTKAQHTTYTCLHSTSECRVCLAYTRQ